MTFKCDLMDGSRARLPPPSQLMIKQTYITNTPGNRSTFPSLPPRLEVCRVRGIGITPARLTAQPNLNLSQPSQPRPVHHPLSHFFLPFASALRCGRVRWKRTMPDLQCSIQYSELYGWLRCGLPCARVTLRMIRLRRACRIINATEEKKRSSGCS